MSNKMFPFDCSEKCEHFNDDYDMDFESHEYSCELLNIRATGWERNFKQTKCPLKGGEQE